MEEKKKSKSAVLSEENQALKQEIETLKAQAEEYKDKWIRNVAEFDNYKKRSAKQWGEAFDEGVASVINKILFVGDNLDWALALGLDEKTADGIRSIRRKYDDTLRSMEIEEINPVGQPFDADVAEAIMAMPAADGEESGIVKQVYVKGYKKGDKVLRYAQVIVTQ